MWDFLGVVAKVGVYSGTAILVGSIFCLWLLRGFTDLDRRIRGYGLLGCVVGAGATALVLLLQVGAITDRGLLGMFNQMWLGILWPTQVGDAVRWRMGGFFLAALTLLCSTHFPTLRAFPAIALAMVAALGASFVLLSFSIVGHAADKSLLAELAVVAHVLVVALWIGSLVPLFLASSGGRPSLALVLRRFGSIMVPLVALLVAAGVYLLLTLPSSLDLAFRSAWGGLILFKMAMVALLLAIAAHNRFQLVPAIERGEPVDAFRFAVLFEMVLAVIILLVTATLSSVTSPP